ncbi:MAG: sigma-70 family RNA polymerase sigma factor [Eubacteriales bacterium]|nr:sigma-70 family RNA polymerase sigma factor [Eubacteriales bacterium]MDD3883268.1 sigma-70 family RNA polymerase sigma factor [Eubacteriales bacterium]MDD4513849.1 sigma-70 family RNA polymerase sigma factor [Eubacteriales bacterium]
MQNTELDLEQIYNDYFKKVYNYIFYRLLHRQETEDLVSKTFVKIVRSIGSYDSKKAQLGTWIMTITANTLRDYYRTRKVTASIDDENFELHEPSVDFSEQYEQIASPRRRALYAALSTLPEQERAMIYDKYFLGMRNREIALKSGMNESTVGSIMDRARKKLCAALVADKSGEYAG